MTAPDPLDPHHDGSVHYTLDDAPALGDSVVLRVRVPHRADAKFWLNLLRSTLNRCVDVGAFTQSVL